METVADRKIDPLLGRNPTQRAEEVSSYVKSGLAIKKATMQTDAENRRNLQKDSPLLSRIPSELIHHILSYIHPVGLASVARTCTCLREHVQNDLLWESWVNSFLSVKIQKPAPYDTFQSLYIAHHPYWFLVRGRIWFSDAPHTGKLLIARYDHRLGSIEAYRAVVGMGPRSFIAWPNDPEVMVHTFDPHVRLWLDDPIVQLERPGSFSSKYNDRYHTWRGSEIPMRMTEYNLQGVFNTFVLCPKAEYLETERGTYEEVDPERRSQLWPPPTVPSEHRIDRHPTQHYLWEQKSLDLESICEVGFRTRRWVQFRSLLPVVDASPTQGVGESMETFSTLDPELYTPTKEKPYQGIWVGDYAGNGCEFLLFLQRDEPIVEDDFGYNVQWDSSSSSPVSPLRQRYPTATPAKQRLDVVKLTGDPNVPRGEVSFRTDDVGLQNTIRIADEEMFKGARVVRAEGHVASRNFQNDQFIPTELILISHDEIAQYWKDLGHVAFYRRVDIDELAKFGLS